MPPSPTPIAPQNPTSTSAPETSIITKLYIPTFPTSTFPANQLPLLITLPPQTQSSIRKYHFPRDQRMSLASALLKTYYIHRTLRIPWTEVHTGFQRTGDPVHGKPGWRRRRRRQKPQQQDVSVEVEFNVTHQASLVALVGTTLPNISLGVDVTCPFESSRLRQSLLLSSSSSSSSTFQKDYEDYVENFSSVFSDEEVREMKTGFPINRTSETLQAGSGDGNRPRQQRGLDSPADTAGTELEATERRKSLLRKFYTHWALKEAYIKMTGEALLAGWLKELEFRDVVPPPLPTPFSTHQSLSTSPSTGTGVEAEAEAEAGTGTAKGRGRGRGRGRMGDPIRNRGTGYGNGDKDGPDDTHGFAVLFQGHLVTNVAMEVRSLVIEPADPADDPDLDHPHHHHHQTSNNNNKKDDGAHEEEWILATCIKQHDRDPPGRTDTDPSSETTNASSPPPLRSSSAGQGQGQGQGHGHGQSQGHHPPFFPSTMSQPDDADADADDESALAAGAGAGGWNQVSIPDIRGCAEGTCHCLR